MIDVIKKGEKVIALLHIEHTKQKGNIYFEGNVNDLVISLVAAMQAEPFLAELFKQAVFTFTVAKGKNIQDFVKDAELSKDSDADKLFKQLMNKEK